MVAQFTKRGTFGKSIRTRLDPPCRIVASSTNPSYMQTSRSRDRLTLNQMFSPSAYMSHGQGANAIHQFFAVLDSVPGGNERSHE